MKRIYFLTVALIALQWGVSAQSLTLVPEESKVSFVIKNMGIDVDGTLSGLKGTMYFNPKNLSVSAFDVTVDVNTINTQNAKRDNHLKTDAFFDASKYPVIRIKTAKIVSKGGDNFTATAVLTIKNVSKNISLPFAVKETSSGYVFDGRFTINRKEFGVGGNSMIMSDNVKVNLLVVGRK